MANKKAKGRMANTRYLYSGEKLSLEKLLKQYKVGDRVVIKPNGKYHEALPFRRFAGHVGEIISIEGKNTYLIRVPDMGKMVKTKSAHIKELQAKEVKVEKKVKAPKEEKKEKTQKKAPVTKKVVSKKVK